MLITTYDTEGGYTLPSVKHVLALTSGHDAQYDVSQPAAA